MSKSAEDRLQTLIVEEKILKSILEEVRSKYVQLQLEHITLNTAHKALLSSSNSVSEGQSENTSTAEVYEKPSHQSDTKNSSSEIEEPSTLPTNISGLGVSEIDRLPFDNEGNMFCGAEYSHMYETQSDESISEDDLDDPSVMNQYKLHYQEPSLQAELETSENELSE